jgi:hypothetical protein
MTISTTLRRHAARILITLTIATAALACAEHASPELEDTYGLEEELALDTELSTSTHDRLQRLEQMVQSFRRTQDREAIEAVASCYGRAQDAIFLHWQDREAGRLEALDILRTCFTEDVEVSLFFFDGPEPAVTTSSLEAWVDFVSSFATSGDYTSARHLIGNVHVELTGPDTARMTSSSITPHYIRGTTDPTGQPTVDLVIGNYVDELVREDGVWRTHRKLVVADEYWRGLGFYPLGQAAAE